MADAIQLDPASLEQPAKRFASGAAGLGVLRQALQSAMHSVASSAQDQVVAPAAETFGQAVGSVFDAFAHECQLMSDKLTAAGVRYRTTDEAALTVHVVDVPLTAPTDGRR